MVGIEPTAIFTTIIIWLMEKLHTIFKKFE